jgi:hypothetical protein
MTIHDVISRPVEGASQMAKSIAGLSLMILSYAFASGLTATGAEAPQPDASAQVAQGVRYGHRLENSRFDVGANARHEVDGPYERIIGDKGVFMIDRVTGATLAVPNAPLAAEKPPAPREKGGSADALPEIKYPEPFSDKAEEHSAAAREYLLSAGIPEAEVSGMHVTATMAGGGPVNEGVQPARSHLLWYTTHLERSVGGVPVEGSFAFAALDRDRRVISEGVYWPEIPQRVVARAVALKQSIASPKEHAEFLTKARRAQPEIGDSEGSVVILHTSSGYHGEFQAHAVYSVVVRSAFGGKAQILRFDDAGSPLRLVDEVAGGAAGGIDSVKER